MIGRISGLLLEKQAPELLVDVQGIGYDVLVSMNTFFDLPAEGQPLTLHTHFVVREDAQQLYGFLTTEERQLFRALIKVNGVGPKVALAILSGVSVIDFVKTVRSGDTAALIKLPGIGKKTAERLLIEMRDAITAFDSVATPETQPSQDAFEEEAESALIALGYKQQEASKMIAHATKQLPPPTTSQALIKLALQSAFK